MIKYVIDNRTDKKARYFDVVQCNFCGRLQAVDRGENHCSCCKTKGHLQDIEQDADLYDNDYIFFNDHTKEILKYDSIK